MWFKFWRDVERPDSQTERGEGLPGWGRGEWGLRVSGCGFPVSGDEGARGVDGAAGGTAT